MQSQGLLTLWAVWNDRLFQAAIEQNIVSGVSPILSEALPAYQPRWLKGVAGVDSQPSNAKLFFVDKYGHTQ